MTYFRIAAKHLVRSKGLNIINSIGLAIGISACLAIWVILRFEFSYDTFHADSDRIYRLGSGFHHKTGEVHYNGTVPMPTAGEAGKELLGVETMAAFHTYDANVTVPAPNGEFKQFPKAPRGPHSENFILVQPPYFDLFHYRWLAGNPGSALAQPFQVVLSAKQAVKYFGSSDWDKLIGRPVIYDDSLVMTVTGIVKELDGNTDLTFTDFISYSTIKTSYLNNVLQAYNWGQYLSTFQVFVKLEKGFSPGRFEQELQAFANRHFLTESTWTYEAGIQPLSDLHFSGKYSKGYGREANLSLLYGLLGIALLILVIAAINFINLSLAQSLQRVREIGIRKIMGSSRAGLVFQFLTETFLLVLLALGISMLMIKPILSFFTPFIPVEASTNILTPATILFIILLLAVTTILSGSYPGWVLSSFQPADALKSKTGIKGGLRDNFRKGLIVFQFCISLVFIITAIIVNDQLHFMLNKDMGFKQDAVITLSTNGKDPLVPRRSFAERVKALSGVDRISMDDLPPAVRSMAIASCTYEGLPPIEIGAGIRQADENYIPLYDIKVIAGRNFFPDDTAHAVLINRTAAKMLNFQHPEEVVGHVLRTMNGRYTVVGVTADFNTQPLTRQIAPLIIQSDPAAGGGYSIKLRTGGKSIADFSHTIGNIEKVWKETFPTQPFVYQFYDETIAGFYDKEQKTSRLVYLGMFIAVFLSCIGLFALAALTSASRKKEIGIRKVMGATTTGLVYLIVKDFGKLVLLSFVIASPVAWLLTHQWLQNYTYRVSVGWWVFALACFSTLLITLFTVGYHVIRVAIANPTRTLRTE